MVAKYIGMKPLDRAHAELSAKMESVKDRLDSEDPALHEGLLYYQVSRYGVGV